MICSKTRSGWCRHKHSLECYSSRIFILNYLTKSTSNGIVSGTVSRQNQKNTEGLRKWFACERSSLWWRHILLEICTSCAQYLQYVPYAVSTVCSTCSVCTACAICTVITRCTICTLCTVLTICTMCTLKYTYCILHTVEYCTAHTIVSFSKEQYRRQICTICTICKYAKSHQLFHLRPSNTYWTECEVVIFPIISFSMATNWSINIHKKCTKCKFMSSKSSLYCHLPNWIIFN